MGLVASHFPKGRHQETMQQELLSTPTVLNIYVKRRIGGNLLLLLMIDFFIMAGVQQSYLFCSGPAPWSVTVLVPHHGQ
jgi:hypothetical protein